MGGPEQCGVRWPARGKTSWPWPVTVASRAAAGSDLKATGEHPSRARARQCGVHGSANRRPAPPSGKLAKSIPAAARTQTRTRPVAVQVSRIDTGTAGRDACNQHDSTDSSPPRQRPKAAAGPTGRPRPASLKVAITGVPAAAISISDQIAVMHR